MLKNLAWIFLRELHDFCWFCNARFFSRPVLIEFLIDAISCEWVELLVVLTRLRGTGIISLISWFRGRGICGFSTNGNRKGSLLRLPAWIWSWNSSSLCKENLPKYSPAGPLLCQLCNHDCPGIYRKVPFSDFSSTRKHSYSSISLIKNLICCLYF